MTYVPFARYYNPTAIVTIVGQVVTFAQGEGLNFSFRVDRSINAEPDSCSLAIEGLDYFRAKLMGAAFREVPIGQVVTVQAGYDALTAGLFTGTLRSFRPNVRRGPALLTYAEADDGGEAYSEAVIQLPASTAGLTSAEMVRIAAVGLQVVVHPDTDAVIAGGTAAAQGPFSAAGVRKAADLMDAAARRLRARWWIRDGQLFMARRVLPSSRPAVIIAVPTPGPTMPGVPVIEELTEDGSGIATCTTFFDPNIVPGGQVRYAGQSFRVERVVHSGETRGASPWSSRIVGRSL